MKTDDSDSAMGPPDISGVPSPGSYDYRQVVQMAQNQQAWARNRRWPGRTGPTDQAMYLAHAHIVERCGHDPHGASARELGRLSGFGWRCVPNANRRLIRHGFLQLTAPSRGHRPAYYSLTVELSLDPQLQTGDGDCALLTLAHDCFRYRGLGKPGYLVWRFLLAKYPAAATVNDITSATGLKPKTVRRRVRPMEQLGMVQSPEKGRWVAVSDVDLDAIAAALGTSGVGERDRRRHQYDREKYHGALDKLYDSKSHVETIY